jgi:transcriptional regulator with XRE-family HTH domain
MARKLSPWCKAVQCELIKRDMSINDLAEKLGKSRQFVSGVVNGRIYAEPTVKLISDLLNITDTAYQSVDT